MSASAEERGMIRATVGDYVPPTKPGFVGEVPCSTYDGDADLSHVAGSPLASRAARQAHVR